MATEKFTPRLDVATWKGNDLTGDWRVTYKIDGVRAIWYPAEDFPTHPGHWMSRAYKPLYNIPTPPDPYRYYNCECYLGNLRDTLRAVRTIHLKPDTPVVNLDHLYELWPKVDPRLEGGILYDPTAKTIHDTMVAANERGYEGLVLRQGEVCLKVKPFDTFDVRVLSLHEGEGKHTGRLGYVKTAMGDVGGGWTDAERAFWWRKKAMKVGVTIEVECMQLTPSGKFRHPRFIRERFDKIADK